MKNSPLAKTLAETRQKLEDAYLAGNNEEALALSRRMGTLVLCCAHMSLGRYGRRALRARRPVSRAHRSIHN